MVNVVGGGVIVLVVVWVVAVVVAAVACGRRQSLVTAGVVVAAALLSFVLLIIPQHRSPHQPPVEHVVWLINTHCNNNKCSGCIFIIQYTCSTLYLCEKVIMHFLPPFSYQYMNTFNIFPV